MRTARLGAALLIGALPGIKAADAAKGANVFAACSVCHDPGHANKTGPGLGGVVGRRAGTAPGFRYSRAMKRSKIIWDADSLAAYLADPQGLVPGNAMPYSGVPDERQRQDLIAYLTTLK